MLANVVGHTAPLHTSKEEVQLQGIQKVQSWVSVCMFGGGMVQGSWNNTPSKDKDLKHDGLDVWLDKAGAGEMDTFQWE